MKHSANILTALRFVFAIGIVLAAPFSAAFWVCYLGGGVSDLLDGPVARALHIQSEVGAKLDSAADLAFAAAIAVVVVRSVPLPTWLWVCAGCVAAVRLAGYGVGFAKYRTFSALHTYANKATGALIFAFPLLYAALGLTVAGVILCVVALFSSIEELILTIRTPTLNRDCKGLYQMRSHREARS
jgi:CDP-diacylglycerol--glycerol-3-phosphate 3-phosphatidyltransferase